MLCTKADWLISSGEKKNSKSCCGAGRMAKTGEGQVVLLSGEPGIGKFLILQWHCKSI